MVSHSPFQFRALHRGHTSGCVCHVPGHLVMKTLHFPKHRAQNVNGILELSYVTSGDVRRVCTFCSCVVSVPDPPVPSSDWFSSGPLCQLSPLYGWDSPVPGRKHPVMAAVLPTHLFGSVGRGNPTFFSVPHWSPGPSPRGADSVLGHTKRPTSSLRLLSIFLPSPTMTLQLLHSLRLPVGAPLEITWWLLCKKH